ncbi:MAG: hypothetical protein AAGI71_01950 [Bacteroidota bacterium]
MIPTRSTLVHIRIEPNTDPHRHPWMQRLLREGWVVVDERTERVEAGYQYATLVLVEGSAAAAS